MVLEQQRTGLWSHLLALVELTKPKIALLELMTVLVAACVASSGIPDNLILVINALVGTALVAASASALNQWLERDLDAGMHRTQDRPLPSGQLTDREAFWFGAVTMGSGTLYLILLVNLTTALIGVVTWFLYVCVYTPLKTRSSANTLVGAIAGAGPVLMGWASVESAWGTRENVLLAATLFGIVFFWQFPHFMAIAWIYREDYAALLMPLSLLPAVMMKTGPIYFLLAFLLAGIQLVVAVTFLLHPSDRSARRMLRASLFFLPLLFGLLWLSPFVFPWL
jgi:protoheme IX farnesyltransferase